MPRPAEFVRSQVLHDAMQTFWRKGYNATSMKDLVKATGLQPGSLYLAFGSKRSLFLESLETYYGFNLAGLNERLGGNKSPVERIRGVFERIIQQSAQDPHKKGCMMVNTLLEMPVDDEEVNNRLGEMFKSVESKLEKVIREGQKLSQINKNKDPKTLAQTMLLGMHGLRVSCKSQPATKTLYKSIDNVLSVLT